MDNLEKVPLERATPEMQKQFFEMLAEQAATKERQKTHKCWFFVPRPEEYEKMKKYKQPPDYDKCPNCKKGRIVIEIYSWELGEAWTAKCYWGKPDCNYEELITDGV